MVQLLSQMAVLTAGRLAGAACVFLITLLLARSFGGEAVAAYSLLLSAASILSVLLPLGFHAIATLFAAEYIAVGKNRELRSFAKYAHKLTFRNALVVYALTLAIAFLLPIETDYNLPVLAVFCVQVAYAMANIYLNSATLMGVEQHYWAHLPDMALRPVLLLAALSFFILLGYKSDVAIFLALLIAVATVMALQWKKVSSVLSALSNSREENSAHLQAEKQKWWDLAQSHMKITLLWDYFFEFHILLAGALLMPTQVAILFVCFRIRQLAGFGMRSLYSLLMPKMFASNSRENKQETQRVLSLSVRVTFAYAIVVWIAIYFIGQFVLQAFGEEYVNATSVLLILMGTMVVRGIFGPASAVLGMHRHAKIVVKILIISLLLSIVLILLGTSAFGEHAIATAYLIATTFSSISIWWVAQRKTGLNTAIWSR